ncbi:MAG: hypothetical protein V7711_14740, partial [Pseudomonadales bacterium]
EIHAETPPKIEKTSAGQAVQQSIAVLPFVNMSSDEDFFADGLSEEILNLLAKAKELKVAGRTSSFAFKGRNEDLREIGKALAVGTVLEGSVRKSGNRLRITAQLINVEDGYHIWSETYDRELTDIFDMQDDIAAKIMAALEVHLGTAPVTRGRPTENMQAYQKFLAAKSRSQESFDTLLAIALLKDAVELDPNFAEAWEFLAIEYWTRAGTALPTAEGAKLAFDAAIKALEINPSLSIAAAMAVSADPQGFTWIREIEMLEKAYADHPDNALLNNALSFDLGETGYLSEALSVAEHWVAIDPLSTMANARYSEALRSVGREAEAIAMMQNAIDLGDQLGYMRQFVNYMFAGDVEAAISAYKSYLVSTDQDPNEADTWLRAAADPATGLQTLNKELAGRDIQERAEFYLAFGHLDEFYDELEQSQDPNVVWNESDLILQLAISHVNKGLSAHPRYIPIMEQMGITELWDIRGPPDRCDKTTGIWVCH